MKKEMLINVRQSEECRIAIIENGVLEELYVDRTSHETFSGNIYKGRIVNLEPAIQAAFVDFSIGRNGFLHVSDVEPRYYRKHLGDDVQLGGRDRGRDPRRFQPGEARGVTGGEPSIADPLAPERPARAERNPRRGDRRGGKSFPRESIPETPAFDAQDDFAGGSDFGFSDELATEQVADISTNDLTTRRGPRPEGRRDRSRRGSGRDRPGRGNRERSSRGPESSEYPASVFEDPAEFGGGEPAGQPPDFDPDFIVDARPDPVLEPEIAAIQERVTEYSEPARPASLPEPVSAFEPPFEPPPAPPARPSFVTRVRRAFGSGLEDWETPEPPASSKVRQVLSPIATPAVKPAAQSPPPAESRVAEPEKEKVSRTVTRSMPPASPDSPVEPEPQPAVQPPASRRRGFGSGLLEDLDHGNSPASASQAEPQRPAGKPAETDPVSRRKAQEPKVQAFGASLFEESTEVESDYAEDFSTSFVRDETVEAVETWRDEPSEVAPPEAADPEFDTTESRSRGRGGRRRSSQSGRGRSRSRRGPDDLAADGEISPRSVDPESGGPDPDSDFLESGETSGAPGTVIVSPSGVPRGRDAIRGRGGNRVSRGPRPQVAFKPVDIPIEPAEPAEEGSISHGAPSRYVPRLERERFGKGRPARSSGYEEGSLAEFTDSEFETAESGSSEIDPAGDPGLGDDPRLNPRSRDGRSRRRRRRRRPGGPETAARPGEPREESEAFEERSGDSESWNELDWSNSPPGAAEALAGTEPESDFEDESPAEEAPRGRGRQRRRPRRGRPGSEATASMVEPSGDDSNDEFLEPSGRGYTVDPDDIVEPELEEEIRREAEEIAVLEIELGIRMPGEIRESPRSGAAPGGRSAVGGGRGFFKPPIQEVFRRNDEVLVQVIKESLGTKGPTLSTYISIPGRYLVLMPGLNRVGVSRKIADDSQRRKLRDLMNQLNPPKGLGFIVRTAGVDRSKRDLARDLAYLLRLWKTILRRIKRTKSPAPIYQESDMIIRTIRDIFNSEIDTIWIDEPSAYERAHEFLNNVMPKFADRLKLYEEKTPLFHKYGIEDEIAKIGMRHVPLPDGGSIVIDQTEALVAIDVNSGNFRVEDDAERTAYEMNLRAAKEIARQLRLRDLGGVIVNDFIDMREERHRRGVERALRDAIRRDRARTKILRMSQFGLIEMTRQRIRPSIKRSIYEDCPHCIGQGVTKTPESMSIDVMRILALAANRNDIRRINITCSHNVANYLNNRKRQDLARLEKDGQMSIHIRPEDHVPAEFLQIDGLGNYNTEFRLFPTAAMTSNRRLPNTTGNAPALPYNPQSFGGHHGHSH